MTGKSTRQFIQCGLVFFALFFLSIQAFSITLTDAEQHAIRIAPELQQLQAQQSATLNAVIWKDTIESLEYRHDVNYGSGDTASGAGTAVTTGKALGRSSDLVTAQIGIYF